MAVSVVPASRGMLHVETSDVRECLTNLVCFVEKYHHISSSHCVEFFVNDLFTALFPRNWRDQLREMTMEELRSIPVVSDAILRRTKGDLQYFLRQSKELRLQGSPFCTQTYVQLSDDPHTEAEQTSLQCFYIKKKKHHEVEKMAPFISELARECGAEQVLDLGSGKGYLSEELALQHKLVVAGVDGSQSHTEEAKKRVEKLHIKSQKLALKKGNVLQPLDISPCKERVQKQIDVNVLSKSSPLIPNTDLKDFLSGDNDRFRVPSRVVIGDDCNPHFDSHSVSQFQSKHIHSDLHPGFVSQLSHDDCKVSKPNFHPNPQSQCTPIPPHQGSITHLPSSSHSHNTKTKSCSPEPLDQWQTSYNPVTMRLSLDMDAESVLKVVSEQSQGKFKRDRPSVLAALHACGDLTCIGLRLFAEVKHISGVCVVGCCYNHITEGGPVVGFPLTEFLRSKKCVLETNTRMLANQSPERLVAEELDHGSLSYGMESMFYRAVLQIILFKEFGIPKDSSDFCVGKVYGKCKKNGGFAYYVQKCLDKLNIENTLSEDRILSYARDYEPLKKDMYAFHQIRGCIAPCIEALIVLDRLLFLREREIEDSKIIAMFDPMTSPRAYAIVARKH